MWKDIDITFEKQQDGDLLESVENDAIKNSITNIWKTLQGSRRMLWPFASPSWGVLFEQIDEITARNIGELLLQSISKWEDRIKVENIHVTAKPDNNQYIVNLTYTIITEGNDSIYNFLYVIKPV
jgi:phage baseplate assembly protein W